MKLNKKVQLAINAIAYMQMGQTYNTESVAKAVGTTSQFMEQIMRKLRLGGLVEAKKGPSGGYKRTYPTDALEIIEAVDGLGKVETGGKANDLFLELIAHMRSLKV
jgi:DNA-binding IscR family transcriptional regulator